MTTKPTIDRPMINQPSIIDAPNLYEDGVFYPEEDGVPLPDGRAQERTFVKVVSTLTARHADQPNTEVSGNTFIYYDRGNPQRSISPDCYVAFDVDVDIILYHNTYRIWAVGKPPDFALEIGSKSTADNDLYEKRDLYAQIGIGEYWRYDPTPDSRHYGERLVGEQLIGGQYRRLPVEPDAAGRPRGHSPALGLDLVWEDGDLRFYDPTTREWLLSYDEEQAARIAAEHRADTAEHRADTAEHRADTAEHRAGAAESRADAEQAARIVAEAELQQLREQLRRLQEE